MDITLHSSCFYINNVQYAYIKTVLQLYEKVDTREFTFQYASIIDIIINIILYFKFASIKSCTYARQKDKKLTIKL